MRTLSLKIDVCTWEGLHGGVPALLAVLSRHRVRATFCLAFGPDNSGKALRNVFRPGFLKKMVRTGAPTTYGLRTMVSGTLLPARPIASAAPELVKRIVDAGHEVAIHGWDHRRWQDQIASLSESDTLTELETAVLACRRVSGSSPSGTAAPGWVVSAASLTAQDTLEFAYASDLRGGLPCRLEFGGSVYATPQIPTTGPCVEELLATGVRDESDIEEALLAGVRAADTAVFAVHAEIEGRAFNAFFDRLLPALRDSRDAVLPLREVAAGLARDELPVRNLASVVLAGRGGPVATSVAREETR